MTDLPGNADIFESIRAIAAAPTENLVELIKIAGLDPAKNLRFQDWTGSSFRGNDLRGFDFTGSRLIGCDFADALITGARFDQAEIARVGFETGHQTNLRAANDWVEFVANWRRREAPMWSFAEALKGASSDRHLRPGMVFQDAPFAPEMAVIPPGRFMMGSPNEEPGCYDNEGPRHEVTIPQALAVGRYAVTFEEWDLAQGDKDWASVTKDYADDEKWGRGRKPVINVSWDDATDYVTWLARRTGQPYRLLSEAEWEYACRAGTSTPFWWGSSITPDQANYNSNYMAGGSKGEYRGKTLPVESFEPNPWGLYQVHGNVAEWCEDVWYYNYEDKPDELKSNGGAWTTGDSFLRVFRGGSWNLDPQCLRSAYRSGLDARIRIGLFGFRVARTLNL